MTIPRGSLIALALLALPFLASPVRSQDQDSARLERLRKELAAIEKDLAAEEQKLATRKSALEDGWKKIKDPATSAKLAKQLAEAAPRFSDLAGTDDLAAAKARLVPVLKPLLEEAAGTEMARLLIDELAAAFVDQLGEAEKFSGAEALRVAVGDVFTEPAFDACFARLKGRLSPEVARLESKRDVKKGEASELEKEIEAARMGVPPGMVAVPAGKYRIGLTEKEIAEIAKIVQRESRVETLRLYYRSTPAHDLDLPAFYIDKREVNCAWYVEFLKDNPDVKAPKHLEGNVVPPGWEDRPVTNISYDDALACARWMGRRIPSEFEWETSARFTNNLKERRFWPWGDTYTIEPVICNGDININSTPRRSIPEGYPPMLPGGSFPEGRSFLGIDDLAGNAAEWTSSSLSPYPGFKPGTDRRSAGHATFEPHNMVIRGGHANHGDLALTTTWRLPLAAQSTSPLIGFRTALSVVRGQDQIEWVASETALKRYLVAFPELPSDRDEKRKYPAIEIKDPEGFTAMMSGGWDPERKLPTRARFISIARRRTDSFRDLNILRELAKDGPTLFGFLQTDIEIAEPALKPGKYFLLWQNSYVPEEPAAVAAENGDAKPEAGERPAARAAKGGKNEKKKPDPIPDAVLFMPVDGTVKDAVRLEFPSGPDFVVAARQACRINCFPAAELAKPGVDGATPKEEAPKLDVVELIYAFPVKYQDKKSFIMTFRLKTAPGVARALR